MGQKHTCHYDLSHIAHVSVQTKPDYKDKSKSRSLEGFVLDPYAFVNHILLLCAVIAYPELTKSGPLLDYFVNEYCHRMSNHKKLMDKKHQQELPFEIEWIWHVHRLHPITYQRDLQTNQISNMDVYEKKKVKHDGCGSCPRMAIDYHKRVKGTITFRSSIDLVHAVERQQDFLAKFSRHYLYTCNLKSDVNLKEKFVQLVQTYVSFMKLADKNQIIVPTFDIDLIWHTHMRNPLQYRAACMQLCGFVLNHDDDTSSETLNGAYEKTAEKWKKTYNTEYGYSCDKQLVQEKLESGAGCALIVPTLFISVASRGGDGYDAAWGGGGGACSGGGCSAGGCGSGC
ncbi:unnamed protein product [Didymodactylos carnosus]|uniref:Glycine-rich domain-containing protein-like n=1 Tax=Didymodactylos carnosus TaxID=1234261 RepID=A0A815MNF5_9BILA|nr:unnamed protein product [Didymodactylos carnosus]CAF4303092.1 unnamed protein product [Didymodactylos carnosus]